MILAESTKPGCGLCEKFKNQIVPQAQRQVDEIAVGYLYNILEPEDARVDQVLRQNLPRATLMPLVGFLTPDLRWIHGFAGQTDVNKFMSDCQAARRIYPVNPMAVAPSTRDSAPAVAVVNEYGEFEWSPAEEVIPEDALEPQDTLRSTAPAYEAQLAAVPSTPPPASRTGMYIPPPPPPPTWVPEERTVAVAPAPAAPAVIASAPPVEPAPVFEQTPMPEPEPVVVAQAPVLPAPAAPTPSWPADGASMSVTWSPPPSEETRPAAPAPTSPAADESDEAWAERMLAAALEQMRAGDLDTARVTLSQVMARVPESDQGLEAARGTVAIHNVRKIQKADAADRAAQTERARKDLAGTRWVALFP
jgi:hypothetical protein